MKPIRPPSSAVLVVTLLAGAGCSSHSIREGIWSLTFDARDFQSQEPVEVPSWKVRVSVDWSEEKPGAEAVEIERLGASGPKSHRFMYGTIPEGGEFLSIDLAMDRFWVFAMYGEIRSEERIAGREFLAKNKEDSQTAFHGSWQMRWLSD